jgi:hypothetical protein
VKICPNPNTPTKADLRIDNPLKLQDLLLWNKIKLNNVSLFA